MKYWPGWLLLVIVSTGRLSAQSGDSARQLEPERAIERDLAGGQSHEYQFFLRTGQYARIRTEQRSINVAAACFGPDGKELFAADAYEIGDTEDVELIADASGTYRLRITASEANAPDGRYEITLRDITAATDRHRERVAAARVFAQGMGSYRNGSREAMLQAIGHLSAALARWRAAGARVEVARTLYTIGLTYIETGNQQKALEYATEALNAAKAADNRRAEGRALNSIGEVHNYFGDKRKAIAFYEEALPLMRTAGDRAGEGNALNNLAVAYSYTGDKSKALAFFGHAEQIFHELQDRRMVAEVYGNLGVTYDRLGEYQKALEIHRNRLQLERELGDRASQAIALNNIATAWSGLGAYQKALDAYTEALELNRLADNRRNVAINLNNLAWIYDELADRKRALKFYEQSLEIVRGLNDRRTTAVTLNNIGEIHADLGNYRKALEIHKEALLLRRAVGDADGEANSLNHLGTTFAKLGERDQARDHFERALAIHRASSSPYMLARTLSNFGALDRETGNNARAVAHLNEAVEICRAIHDRSGEARAREELSRVEFGRGNYALAHQRAEEAFSALESVRMNVASPSLRASFFATARDVQELDIEILMRLHLQQPDQEFAAAALLASERGRARSLLELLHEAGTNIRSGVDTALLERERELELLISAKAEQQTRLLSAKHTETESAAAAKDLDGLATELEQVQSRVRETSPQYAALTEPVPLKLDEIQTRVLDEDTVLLEYALGAKKSFVWAVTQSSMQVFELPPRAEIESVARRVRDLLTARNQKPKKETPAARASRVRQADEAYFPVAVEASKMLLGPVRSIIAGKRLLIVGEGVLQHLPFVSLPEPADAEQRNAVPLIVNHEIVTAPSASVMALLRQGSAGRQPAEKSVAIVADPVFSADDARIAQEKDKKVAAAGPEYARLRFSRDEADAIVRLAPAGMTLKALDFDASRDTVLAPEFGRYRIVHFATHSLLNDEHPELSGIVLSLFDRFGNAQNGFLRLYDIYNLRLGADLAVLSACQTALGEEITGEGMMGLTRGFLYAGAPRVVASLWEVDDRTTAELMKRFYEGMLSRGETPAAALRTAQVGFWRSRGWDGAYYWAAFTLQGEWR